MVSDPDELSDRFRYVCVFVLILVFVGIGLQVLLTYVPPPGGATGAGAGQLHDLAGFLAQSGAGALIGLIVGKTV